MSEGNASVEVAALKAEINIDLDKFEEALDQATEMFENFADNIDRALAINLHINDEDLSEVESQVEALKDSLSSVTGGDISEDINSEGSEETIEELEKIKELEEEINNYGLDVDLSNDDIDTVIQQLEEVKSNLSNIDNTENIINFSEEDIDNVIAQLQELKETEEQASDPVNINIEANGAGEVKEEVEGIGEAETEAKGKGQELTETLGTSIYALQAVYSALSRIAESSLEQFAQLQISGEIATRTFGSFGDNLNQFASTSVNALGLTSGETEHYADTLGLALKSQGASNQVAEQMAKSLVGVADNLTLASGGSMTMQQSVQILTSALAGQTYGLKSLGINVTGVNKKWTPLHQAMFIMNQVTKDVTTNFGTLGQNMDTTAGEIQKAKAITGQFGESIGEILAPQLEGLNKHLESLYHDWNGLSNGMKKGIVAFTEVGLGILGVAATLSVAMKAVEVMEGAFEGLTAIMETNPIIAILGAIVIAIGLLYESWKHNWLGMRNIIDGVIKDLTPVFHGFVNFIKEDFKSLQPAFKQFERLWELLKPLVEDILKALGASVVVYTKMMVEDIKLAITVITDVIKVGGDIIKNVFDAIGNTAKILKNVFKDVCTSMDSIFKNTENVFTDVENAIISIFDDVTSFFNTTIPNWINFIADNFNRLPAIIGNALGYALGSIVRWGENTYNYFASSIPQWISDIGNWFEQLPGEIGDALDSALNGVEAWGSSMISSAGQTGSQFLSGIGSEIEQLPGEVSGWLSSVIGSVESWGSEMISTGVSDMEQFGSGIVSAMASIPGQMVSIGGDIVRGIGQGIMGAAGWLMSEVESFASSVVSGFKSALDIHSPSRVMASEVGQWIPAGIGVGIENAMPELTENIHQQMEHMVAGMNNTIKNNMQEMRIPWTAPRMVNNDVNTNNPLDVQSSNIQTTGVVGGQTNNFTINESANGSDTANEVIHKLRLAHFGIG